MVSIEEVKGKISELKQRDEDRKRVEAARKEENRLQYEQEKQSRRDELLREQIREKARSDALKESKYGSGVRGAFLGAADRLAGSVSRRSPQPRTARAPNPTSGRYQKAPRQNYAPRNSNPVARSASPIINLASALHSQAGKYSEEIYGGLSVTSNPHNDIFGGRNMTPKQRKPGEIFDV